MHVCMRMFLSFKVCAVRAWRCDRLALSDLWLNDHYWWWCVDAKTQERPIRFPTYAGQGLLETVVLLKGKYDMSLTTVLNLTILRLFRIFYVWLQAIVEPEQDANVLTRKCARTRTILINEDFRSFDAVNHSWMPLFNSSLPIFKKRMYNAEGTSSRITKAETQSFWGIIPIHSPTKKRPNYPAELLTQIKARQKKSKRWDIIVLPCQPGKGSPSFSQAPPSFSQTKPNQSICYFHIDILERQ